VTTAPLVIDAFVTGPLQENAYLVRDRETGKAAIIDPGDDAGVLIEAIEASGARLQAIWLTHAHFDHIGAVAPIRRRYGVPVHLHEADLPLFEAGPMYAASFGLPFEGDEPPGERFVDGQGLRLGELSFEVMHTPGHSPGHVVIHGHGVAFAGDCLFAGSVGRTDLPLSSAEAFGRSLSRIVALPGATRVLPGHGPATTIEAELRTNPFLPALVRGLSR
jgi:glyoxylase-like metal-dependent hydrolase (beta-lactamase superfamily II)